MALEQSQTSSRAEPEPDAPHYSWHQKAFAIIWVFFCFEIGTFLILFPWLELWDRNYFSGFGQVWYDVWNSPYFRGAVSGLGLVDVGISFVELFRLRRFARRQT